MKFIIHETVPHSTRVWFSIRRPRTYFHELAKNSLLTKILPPEKYPLYGIPMCGSLFTLEMGVLSAVLCHISKRMPAQ